MINTFNEYKKKCLNTWIKDEQSNIRTILGIVGESGEVATINIEKLQKRLNENKIKGSGDER